jgi:hypothetical protein
VGRGHSVRESVAQRLQKFAQICRQCKRRYKWAAMLPYYKYLLGTSSDADSSDGRRMANYTRKMSPVIEDDMQKFAL